ncbi:MAG: formylglycine-generating enzyme family protein [Verrucomicrobia subdivision 3 bacterium]|nr:formylglycine-generating enzyme family protein [Limisphaerales bacterium]
MVWIPSGTFKMGWADGPTDEAPVHRVKLDGFWMGVHEVTNDEFAKFVAATKYVTLAEEEPTAENLGITPEEFANIPKDKIVAGSIVFTPPAQEIPVNMLKQHNMWSVWWRHVGGTNWRHPEGPDSDISGRGNHPVVHVSWDDAHAYCAWLTDASGVKHRLPSEAEWEYAARGGLEGKEYVWGDEQQPDGNPHANIWQGRFPRENTKVDGFYGTAPVGTFPANGYGLHDVAGNVWEWCADWYAPTYYSQSPVKNPGGPLQQDSFDPNDGRNRIPKRIQRGGSFLCTDLYCGAFRPSRRMKNTPDSGSQHSGFRVVADGPAPTQ